MDNNNCETPTQKFTKLVSVIETQMTPFIVDKMKNAHDSLALFEAREELDSKANQLLEFLNLALDNETLQNKVIEMLSILEGALTKVDYLIERKTLDGIN